jgi:MFS family permease
LPFFGVAVLMAIGLTAITVFLPKTPRPPREARVSLLEPLRALRHRATRGSGLTAVFYNFGLFTLLGYAPFPLHLDIHKLSYTFTGWGLMLAVFAVFVAPRLSRRFSDVRALAGSLLGVVAAHRHAVVYPPNQAMARGGLEPPTPRFSVVIGRARKSADLQGHSLMMGAGHTVSFQGFPGGLGRGGGIPAQTLTDSARLICGVYVSRSFSSSPLRRSAVVVHAARTPRPAQGAIALSRTS